MAAKPTVSELTTLLDYCKTDLQRNAIQAVLDNSCSGRKAAKALGLSKSTVNETISRVRRYAADHGYAPAHGLTHTVPDHHNVRRVSTLRNSEGEITAQWVISEPEAEKNNAILSAIESLALETLTPLAEVPPTSHTLDDDLLTTYISNDLHLGLLIDGNEADKDWDLEKGLTKAKHAIDHLVTSSPDSERAIVVDLGDIVEADDRDNRTKRSGHSLDVDGFHHNIFEKAYNLMIYFIQRTLEKHDTVFFYSLPGNHDDYTAFAVHHVVKTAFMHNPRVIFSDSVARIHYHHHGKVLLGFAHGDAIKPAKAETAMVADNHAIWSETEHRYFHFGHIHSFKSEDKSLCTVESHRHLIPLNAWAFNNGFRGPLGTMRSITYSASHGEATRTTYNVSMNED